MSRKHTPPAPPPIDPTSDPLGPTIPRDRVKEFRRVKGRELADHAGNWRVHPQYQEDALQGILSTVGIADVLIAYHSPRAADALTLIDGHLRKSSNPDLEWPTVILDVTDEEADLLLATHDSITGAAETDANALRALVAECLTRVEDLSLRSFMVDLEKTVAGDPDAFPDPDDDAPPPPEMALQPFEHYDYVVLMFRKTNDFQHACNVLGIRREAFTIPGATPKIGLGRVIDGAAALRALAPQTTPTEEATP